MLPDMGQRVWLFTADLPGQFPTRKLPWHFVGPFPITKVVSPVAVRFWLPDQNRFI